jgi:hypothetical protein
MAERLTHNEVQVKQNIIAAFAEMGISEDELKTYSPENVVSIIKGLGIDVLKAASSNVGIGESVIPKNAQMLTPDEMAKWVKMTRVAIARAEKRGRILTEVDRLWHWDTERREAHYGDDPIARLCTMNNYLWYYFRLAKKRGERLSGEQVAHLKDNMEAFGQFFVKEVSGQSSGVATLFSDVHVAAEGMQERKNFDTMFNYLLSLFEDAEPSCS